MGGSSYRSLIADSTERRALSSIALFLNRMSLSKECVTRTELVEMRSYHVRRTNCLRKQAGDIGHRSVCFEVRPAHYRANSLSGAIAATYAGSAGHAQ